MCPGPVEPLSTLKQICKAPMLLNESEAHGDWILVVASLVTEVCFNFKFNGVDVISSFSCENTIGITISRTINDSDSLR